MAIWQMILIVLHVVPGVYWAGTTFALARDPMMGNLDLGRAQAGAAGVVVLMGIILMVVHYDIAPGAQEWVLGIGALLAIAAAGVQHGLAWPARRRLARSGGNEAADRRRATVGQRIASLLLALAVCTMVIWRYI